jgi:hypothetical protein
MLELFYEAYIRDIDFYDTYGTTLSLCGDVADNCWGNVKMEILNEKSLY